MDNLTAKEILSAYRSNGADANDENFRAALEQCRNDPEMKTWLEEQQAFDRKVAAALRSIHGPEEGKHAILGTLPFEQTSSKPGKPRRRWIAFFSAGVAALLMLSVLILNLIPGTDPSFDRDTFALANLAREATPFDYRGQDTDALVSWLSEQGAPSPKDLPEAFKLASAAGCRIFTDGQGGQISLLCLEIDSQIVHVFVFDDQTRQLLTALRNQWWQEDEWNMMAYEHESDLLAIVTQADPQTVDQIL